jgi:hypothetical protein
MGCNLTLIKQQCFSFISYLFNPIGYLFFFFNFKIEFTRSHADHHQKPQKGIGKSISLGFSGLLLLFVMMTMAVAEEEDEKVNQY